MAKDPISELSGVNKELKNLNSEIKLLEAGLKRITGLAGKAFGAATGVFSSGGLGQGSNMMLGTQNAQFGSAGTMGGSMMPWAYSKTASATIGGVQLGLGLAGAAYSALPGLSTVMPRATGFYQATTMLPGTTRAQLTSSTMSNMRGGITGPNEDVAATNILANSFGFMGSNLAQGQREVRGAALGLALPNATAAQAIGSMHTGDFSGRMYQLGISTLDVKTGQVRAPEDIARQMYQRVMGNKTLTKAQMEFSMREGTLNKFLNDTTDSTQQAILRPLIQQIALGQNPSLQTMTGKDNPLTNTLYAQQSSDMALANRATEPMIQGYQTVTQQLVNLNSSLQGLPDSFFKLKGALDSLGLSNTGNAVSGAVGAVVGAAGTVATGAVLRSVLKAGAGEAAKTGAKAVGLGALGKAAPILGGAFGAATGQGLLSSVFTSAAVGGAFGMSAGPGGALAGALGAGAFSALGWLGANAFKAMSSTATQGLGTANLNLPANADTQLIQTLQSAGFTGQGLVTAYGVAKAESGGNSNAYNGKGLDKSYGLFQINMENNDPRNPDMGKKRNASYLKKYKSIGYTGPESLLDPNINAKIAYDISKQGTKFNPWSTYNSGSYQNQLGSGGVTGNNTVNINLKIDKASDAEAVAFAKKVKDLLIKDTSLSSMGSK